MSTLVGILIAILITLILSPYLLPVHSDIDIFFLHNQANISNLRYQDESAIYRNYRVPFTSQLLTGLSVQNPETGRLSNGDYRTIHQLLATAPVAQSYQLSKSEFAAINLGNLVDSYAPLFVSQKGSYCVLPTGPSIEALAVVLAALFMGVDVVLVTPSKENLPKVWRALASSAKDPNHCVGVFTTKELTSRVPSEYEVYDLAKISKTSSTAAAMGTTFGKLQYLEVQSGNSYKFASYDCAQVIAGVAGEIKALPDTQQWTDQDKIAIMTPILNPYIVVSQLAAIVTQSRLYFPPLESFHDWQPQNIMRMIESADPTVIVTDDETSLMGMRWKGHLRFLQTLKRLRVEVSLSYGKMPKFSVLPVFQNLRLLHTFGTCDFYLKSSDCALLRSVGSVRIVHALALPLVAPCAVAQSNPYDYRIFQGQEGMFGALLPCVEGVAKEYHEIASETDDHSISDKTGILAIRGPAVGEREWCDTQCCISWGDDGCLYLRKY